MASILSGTSEQPKPATEYDLEVLERQKNGEKVETPDPWECCPHVSTPLGLFDKIWADNYTILSLYLNDNFHQYPLIRSTLILLSNAVTETHSTDCINAAINLASYQLETQKKIILHMLPLAKETFNKRRAAKMLRNEQKERSDKIIIDTYNKYMSSESPPKNLQELIALDTKFKQPKVSKCLKEYGLNKKSRKKLS